LPDDEEIKKNAPKELRRRQKNQAADAEKRKIARSNGSLLREAKGLPQSARLFTPI